MFKTILFPVDRSREARQAADVAIEVVKKYQARLVVLSVVEPAEGEDINAASAAATDLLNKVKVTLQEVGIAAELKIAQGKPAFAICDVADEVGADLIIIGSRGMSLTDEHPEGSVSQKVINLSPCPVLVVP
jgi:nucleotide-binding universal stress UspA family protein